MRAVAALLCALVVAAVTPAAQRPLPDADAFFAEARKRLASNPDLRAPFAYRERRIEPRLNPFGRMGSGPEEMADVFPGPAPGLGYRRVIRRDGQPLPARELAAQDREYLERVQEHRQRRARETPRERARRLAREQDAREEAEALADEVIGLFDFAIEGRDVHEGHPAIVVRFSRKPGASPRSREATLAAAFEGRGWVHEHEYELMRLEARAIEDVSFGFGLIARLHRGATVTIRRQKFGDRWLPAVTRFSGTGRALLIRRVDFEAVYEFSDYRAFDPARLPEMLTGGQ